jgi:peptidoglycan/LPS O-acetylase OafA/YrhL
LGTISFDYNTSLSEISTIKHLPIFFIGTLISVLEVLRKNLITDNFNKTVIDTLGILALIIIFLVFNPSTFNIFFAGHLKNSDSLLFIPIACLWGIVLLSAKYGSVVTTFFEYKPLRFVGVISFSVYLFHLIILNFVNRIPVISEIKFYVFFVLVLICASITYLFIERKISKLKIKF